MIQPFNLKAYLDNNTASPAALHQQYLNHQLVKVLKTTGFDSDYVSAKGAWLYDENNNAYLDFLSGFGVYALGRSHPVVKQALIDAIEMDLPNLVQLDHSLLPGLLARELIKRAHPNLTKVFFTNSGTESIEGAIKFARKATSKERIVGLNHAFHGLSTGSLALNGSNEFKAGFGPLLPKVTHIELGDLKSLENQLKQGDVAGFVVELIQGKGVYMADASYWQEVQELCRKYQTIFIVDEVQTGLGRTGKFFCYEHYQLKPDIVTISKALSGGFIPVGAILMTKEIHSKVFNSMENAVVHSSTFGQNHLAMVAGLATLYVLEGENLIENAQKAGEKLVEKLKKLTEKYEAFNDVRGLGLMIGMSFSEPKSLSLRSKFKLLEAAHKGLFSQLIVSPLYTKHRIITQVAAHNVNIIKILPPLIIQDKEINYFVDALDDVLQDMHKGNSAIYEFGKNLIKTAITSR